MDPYGNQIDGDSDDEDAAVGIQDPAILERLNEALSKQLQGDYDRIAGELREKDEALRRAKQRRQDIGVELYGVQQQLARMQMQLEKTHENFNAISKMRDQAEVEIQQLQRVTVKKRNENEDFKKKAITYQSDLDRLNLTVRQVELYNEQQKHEIAVTRRITYKAEETVSNLEREKKSQDFLIDQLNEQMKALHEQLALYEAQLISQKKETKSAGETLAEAATEMEAINFEKKQLLQQWKSSIIGMQRRDDALQAAESALRQQQEQILSVESEISGYRSRIKSEQDQNEKLVANVNKLQTEATFLQKQIEGVKEKRERLNERYSLLKRSLDQTDAELQKSNQDRTVLQRESALVNKKAIEIAQEIQTLEDDIYNKLSEQKTIDKGTQNVLASAQKMRRAIHEKEMQLAQLQNEVARIRVDMLNTQSHNTRLKESVKEVDSELKQRSQLVEKYELEIRRRNDEIEKKQSEVDRLNRKLDQLLSNLEDENLGPLEATIHNLSKSINAKEKECVELQRAWINDQNELVSLQQESNNQSEGIQSLKSEHAILNQRRIRVEAQLDSHENEQRELENGIRQMRTDMSKLNELLAKNSAVQEGLLDMNFNMENEFVRRLKELEIQSIKLEASLEAVKDEKARILSEIVELENQAAMWERKIQLEREMAEALDPTVGTEMTQGMRREIHRMELRFAELGKRQEWLIKEVEKCILRRDTIGSKGRTVAKTPGATQAGVRKNIDTIARKLKETEAESNQVESMLRELDDSRNAIGMEMDEAGRACEELKNREDSLVAGIDQDMNEKLKNLAEITRLQRVAKHYGSIKDGKYAMSGPPEKVLVEIETQLNRSERLRTIMKMLSAQYPSCESNIEGIMHMLPE